MTDQPTTPPPGWYADPGGTAELRWWDGQAWTAHTNQADPAGANPTTTNPTLTSSTSAEDVPWWAQSNDGKPPDWWADGSSDQRDAWNASNAVGDRLGPGDPSTFGVPGAVPESHAAPVAGPYAGKGPLPPDSPTPAGEGRLARWTRRRGAGRPRTR